MLTIFYPPHTEQLTVWQARLAKMILPHRFMEEKGLAEPRLEYQSEQVEGTVAIEAYLDKLETFVEGWYEDRCDKYEE